MARTSTKTKAKGKRLPSVPECCRRKADGNEVFRYLNRNFVFDVDRANCLVRDGREPVEVSPESLRRSIEECADICEEHIAHVDPSRPGIIAHTKITTVEGETVRGHVLIDGNHRGARCLQLGKPFRAFLLTESESEEILVHSPRDAFVLKENADHP